MKLFLQGPRQIGKSTILRDALLPHESHAAGLMVQRLFENGAMCGFRACVVDGTLPALTGAYEQDQRGIFLYNGHAFPHVLEDAVAEALTLCRSPRCTFIILDEIGGMELLSTEFMQYLQEILLLEKPCLGVIKSRDNLAHTASRLKLADKILPLRDALQQTLEADGKVLTVTEENRAETRQIVTAFINAYLIER
ncbi:MAG: nucleoside-triphosphatase [Muricomes sp.]